MRGATRTRKTQQALQKILNQQPCAVQPPVSSPAGRGRARDGKLAQRGSRRSVGKANARSSRGSIDSVDKVGVISIFI